MRHCSSPIMVENVGLLIFLRESASATVELRCLELHAPPQLRQLQQNTIKRSRRAMSISSSQFRHRICGVWSFTPLRNSGAPGH